MSESSSPTNKTSITRHPLFNTIPLTFMFLIMLVIPLFLTITISFRPFDYDLGPLEGWTFEHYLEVFSDGYFLGIFGRTLWISALVTLICLLIGVPQSYILGKMRRPWRSIFLLIILSPLLISLVVRAFGWSMLLNPMGIVGRTMIAFGYEPFLYTPAAVVVGLVHVMLPFMVIPVWSALQKIDPSTEAAALSLSANRLQTLFRIVLPQAIPGILSGCLIVFGLTTSSFAIPVLLGGGRSKMISNVIYEQFLIELNWPLGGALAIVLLLMNLIIMLSYSQLLERLYKRRLGG